MGVSFIVVGVITAVFASAGIIGPIVVPRSPNRSLIQCMIILVAACMWLFWLLCYMHQMNPLIGPKIDQHTVAVLSREWGLKL